MNKAIRNLLNKAKQIPRIYGQLDLSRIRPLSLVDSAPPLTNSIPNVWSIRPLYWAIRPLALDD